MITKTAVKESWNPISKRDRGYPIRIMRAANARTL